MTDLERITTHPEVRRVRPGEAHVDAETTVLPTIDKHDDGSVTVTYGQPETEDTVQSKTDAPNVAPKKTGPKKPAK